MNKKQIQIGLVYSAKVGGALLPVRIDKSLGHGRYEAASMPSGKTLKVSTAVITGEGQTLDEWKDSRTPKEHDLPVPVPAAKDEKPKTAGKAKKQRGPSGLDAAVVVLSEAKQPMTTGDMVKRMLETGLWKTGGKTPSATIYAAIITEIAKKGQQSRFRKTGRGMFELTEVGKGVK